MRFAQVFGVRTRYLQFRVHARKQSMNMNKYARWDFIWFHVTFKKYNKLRTHVAADLR